MNAIGSPSTLVGNVHRAGTSARLPRVNILARATVAIAWIALAAILWLVMLDATFGYTAGGRPADGRPTAAPPMAPPRLQTAPYLVTAPPAARPEPAPAPGR